MSVTTFSPASTALLQGLFARAMTRAGEALGEMSGRPVKVGVPEIRRCTPADVVALAGGPDAVVVGIYLGIGGSLQGHALLLLPPREAHRLAGLLLADLIGPQERPPEDDAPSLNDLEASALGEVGNVTIGAFLNELGMHLREPVQPTVPQPIVEMAGAILDAVLLDLAATEDELLAARTTFTEGDRQIDGIFLVLPQPGSLRALLAALGMPD